MKTGRNDPCPCGSRKKYKYCCIDKNKTKASKPLPSANTINLTLKQRSLTLINAINDIFGFNKGAKWEKIKQTISGEQIRELYRAIAWLWPKDTDFVSLIPKVKNKLRALYLGDVYPEMIVNNVLRIGLYAEEIFIIDPFHNPWCMAKKYNPIENPDQYKADTLKLLYFILMLEPWIKADIVSIIPDPGDFDYNLRKRTWDLAKERLGNFKPSERDLEYFNPISRQELARFIYTMPDSYLIKEAKKFKPDITKKEIQDVIENVRRKRKQDPLALDMPVGKVGEQMAISRTGANLDMGMYISQIIDAFPFTNIPKRWEEILSISKDLPEHSQTWSPLTNSFQSLDFKFLNNVDPEFACSLRLDGRLESFRNFLRKIWRTVCGEIDPNTIQSRSSEFKDELKDEFHKAEAEWESIDREMLKWVGTTLGGAIITGSFSLGLPALGFSILGVTQLINSHLKHTEFRKKVPMSVFIDLKKKK